MCLGIPGEVIEVIPEQPELARVQVSSVRRVINVGLLSYLARRGQPWPR